MRPFQIPKPHPLFLLLSSLIYISPWVHVSSFHSVESFVETENKGMELGEEERICRKESLELLLKNPVVGGKGIRE